MLNMKTHVTEYNKNVATDAKQAIMCWIELEVLMYMGWKQHIDNTKFNLDCLILQKNKKNKIGII